MEHNRKLNQCKFTLVNKAIAYGCTEIELNIATEFVGSNVARTKSGKTAIVEATNISDIMRAASFQRAGIVCDIEDAEAYIIKRCQF